MTIGGKVGMCFAATILLSGSGGGVSWYAVNGLGNRLDRAVGVTTRKVELAGRLRAEVYTFRLQERGILLFSHIQAPEQVAACLKAYDAAMDQAFHTIEEIRQFVTQDDRGWIDQAEAGIREYKVRQFEVRQLVAQGKIKEATESDKKNLVTTGGRIIGALDHFEEVLHATNVATAEEGARTRRIAEVLVVVVLAGWLPVGMAVFLVLRRMTRGLQMTSSRLQHTAAQVASAAHTMAASSQSLAQAASEQAASLEETSASTEEISSMARRNTDSAANAARTVDQSEQDMTAASGSLAEMVTAMVEIEDSGSKISQIIKVIDEIAFQTNILALNAAVEAARAGESGLGFAVVADEVRNLAHRCSQAAKETAQLIEESIGKSHAGKERVDRVAKSIEAITAGGAALKVLVSDVSKGTHEQCLGIEQIARTITQMQKATSATAAGSEESASASHELRAQSNDLYGAVKDLMVLVGGRSADDQTE